MKVSLSVVGFAAGVAAFCLPLVAMADTVNVNFESPTYSIGNINTQDGWSKTGSYDVAVDSSYGVTSFGSQSLRISNAVTSGSFGDQTFSKSLVNEAGEANAISDGNSGGTRQTHFEAQFDLRAMTVKPQTGLLMSVSPDRGDGARMSYLRFEDQSDGVHVFFDDVTDPSHVTNADTFNETDIATLNRTVNHTIKFVVDFVNGPDNDVVKIYIDGSLVKTGTTWEDYFLFDTESNPTLANNSRTVDSLLFRVGGSAVPANAGVGFLVDNLTLSSSVPLVATTSKVILTSGTSWTVPADWNNADNKIEVIGGGGNGGNGTFAGASGGGGGGGAYSKVSNVTLTPSSSVTIQVGGVAGDTYLNGASCAAASVCAKGGASGSGTAPGAGGASASGVGTTKFSGGSGQTAVGTYTNGGGGGGAAGLNGAGNAGSASTGGSGDTGSGGAGGATFAGVGHAGTEYDATHGSGGGGGGGNGDTSGGAAGLYGAGGGGGGAADSGPGSGGAGKQGLIVVTYTHF